ncbi:MAG: serine/threonine protein kinase [Kofleriaceae bacterium]|nr:serine/threonine protein kinase [Kofleriaceae bacterium]
MKPQTKACRQYTASTPSVVVDDEYAFTRCESPLLGSSSSSGFDVADEIRDSTEPAAALFHQEQARTRRTAPLMALLSTMCLLSLPLFGGTSWAKYVLYGTLVPSILAMLWLWWLATQGPVQGWQTTLARLIAFSGACACCVFFGVYSPAPMGLLLPIIVYAQSDNRPLARATYAGAALTQSSVVLLDIAGIVADPGIIGTGAGLSTSEQIAAQFLIQVILLAAYLLGRYSRRTSSDAVFRTRDAMHKLARRDVVAQEAREKALRAFNIGGMGRYSGTTWGQFRLSKVIGYGGMGEVYRATHLSDNSLAAVKIIHPHLCGDEKLLKRFFLETELSTSIQSPYIVRVLETGTTPQGPFIAMELLPGKDLGAHLQTKGLLNLEELQELARQVGAALDVAAQANVVHRDIKPQNIFLIDLNSSDGQQANENKTLQCKLLDFGVARVMSGHSELTQRDIVLGTPSYISPEQAIGRAADQRSDLHALAAVLYRACTGFLPFNGDQPQVVLHAVVHDMPKPVSELAAVPKSLDAFFVKAMAKNPDDRFQSGQELSEALKLACV